MATKKRSLFERLTGSVSRDDYDFDDESKDTHPAHPSALANKEDAQEGQLPVDVFQTDTDIVIRAFVAGVRPDELNVSISRDMVVIEGSREERSEVHESDYFTRELFWGSFARTILLPNEIDVDAAVANTKDGFLTITLPKYDKARQTKLKIRSN